MFEHLAFTSSSNINISKNKNSKVNKRKVNSLQLPRFLSKKVVNKTRCFPTAREFFLKYFIFSKNNNNKNTCQLSSARSTLNIYFLILLGTQ